MTRTINVGALPAREVYERLYGAYGPQSWWPAESPLEVIIGAVLVQNTAWSNVERAIAQLKAANLMDAHRLMALSVEQLEELIRPAGVFRVKAKRLRAVLTYLVERHAGDIAAMARTPHAELRRELLALHGVGPETADSILLYACEQPSFVIDAYTRRVLERHGWADRRASYDQLKQAFETALPRDVPLFNEYHALIVEVGKRHCRRTPRCEGCPLECLLPGGGPVVVIRSHTQPHPRQGE